MRWIESAGGPLLLLHRESLGEWGGVAELMTGPAADDSWSPRGEPTDYDRACSVQGYLGMIAIGAGQGIVLGDEPLRTAWIPFRTRNGGIFVRWVFGEDEREFLDWVDTIPETTFRPTGSFTVTSSALVLFDSAVAGWNVTKRPDEYLSVDLQPGIYHVETASYKPDARTWMIVHRLMRLS
jgi:hypothetical protein